MPFNLDDKGIAKYLTVLEGRLMAKVKTFRGSNAYYNGVSSDDVAHQVTMEVAAFLIADADLPRGRRRCDRVKIRSLDELTEWACEKRLKAVHDSVRKAAWREGRYIDIRCDEVAEAAMAARDPEEHSCFDRAFLNRLFERLRGDTLAYQVALLVTAAQRLPWSRDLDVCNNKLIAEALGCDEADVINARRRIETVKNRLLAERAEQINPVAAPEEDD